jgi:hypothetical protein
MEPNQYEIESSKVFAINDELETGKMDLDLYGHGSNRRVYDSSSKETLDLATKGVCKRLQVLSKKEIKNMSPETQMWWRDHVQHDKDRLLKEFKSGDWDFMMLSSYERKLFTDMLPEKLVRLSSTTRTHWVDPTGIANHRAKHYSSVDGYLEGSKKWDKEVNYLLKNPIELKDWIENNMNYSDWSHMIIKTDENPITPENDVYSDIESVNTNEL